jgi:hypothetical protein
MGQSNKMNFKFEGNLPASFIGLEIKSEPQKWTTGSPYGGAKPGLD